MREKSLDRESNHTLVNVSEILGNFTDNLDRTFRKPVLLREYQ
jgi:hypothetical protein